MAARLKLVLQNQILPLVLKPIIFGGLLVLVWLSGFSWWSLFIFFVGNFLIYIYPLSNSLVFSSSFVILVLLSLISLKITLNYWWLSLLFIVFSSILFCVVINAKNLNLVNKDYWYYLFNLALFYLIFVNFFVKIDAYFTLKTIFLFLAAFFLFREFIKIYTKYSLRERNLLAFMVGLLAVELGWAVSWLPISFIFGANILFSAIYLGQLYLSRITK